MTGTITRAWPEARPAPDSASLPLAGDGNIQGNVLAGFNKDHQMLLLIGFTDTASARAWLTELRPRLSANNQVASFNQRFSALRRTAGTDPENHYALWSNVSFTAAGIDVLAPGTTDAITAHGDVDDGVQAWITGAADRDLTDAIGDTDPAALPASSPDHWLFGNGNGAVHAIVCVAADRARDLEVELARHRELLARHGLVIRFEQPGATLTGAAAGHEHFGFKDGISQPGVIGFDPVNPDNSEEVAGKPGTDLIAAGTFVLGYPRDDGTAIPVPRWMFDGSFLVTRRLAQDVPGFWAGVQEQHATLDPEDLPAVPTADALAAKLVGRWRSGTPTDLAPTADNRSAQDPDRDNDFDFSEDRPGLKTPVCAHIRKVYPRSGARPLVDEDGTKIRRILRRGIPFGPPFQPTAGRGDGVDAERGLVFQCYQSSLQDGFVFLQKVWVDNGNFPDAEAGNDAVIGLKSDITLPITAERTKKLSFQQFVSTEGSVFSITPSLPVIEALAAGADLEID